MNDLEWLALIAAVTGLLGRIAKLRKLPSVPKGVLPYAVLVIGYLIMLGRLVFIDGIAWSDAALQAWTGLAAGQMAVGGHRTLKPGLVWLTNEQIAEVILGRLPGSAVKMALEPGVEIAPMEDPTPTMTTEDTKPKNTGGAAALLFLFLTLAFGLLGCGPSAQQVQARVADAMAKSVSQAKAELLVAYEEEGDAAIPAPDREASDAQLDAVKEKWKLVWDSIKAFALVHDQWATAIETGEAIDLEGVLGAFCELVGLAKPWLKLPDIPGVACPEVSP